MSEKLKPNKNVPLEPFDPEDDFALLLVVNKRTGHTLITGPQESKLTILASSLRCAVDGFLEMRDLMAKNQDVAHRVEERYQEEGNFSWDVLQETLKTAARLTKSAPCYGVISPEKILTGASSSPSYLEFATDCFEDLAEDLLQNLEEQESGLPPDQVEGFKDLSKIFLALKEKIEQLNSKKGGLD
jgi:hypothetical protein